MGKAVKHIVLPLVCAVVLLAGCQTEKEVQITSLKLNISEITLQVGASVQLEATTNPADAGVQITWTTSNDAIATVSDDGLVTGVGYGSATVTAHYGSYLAKCAVTIISALPLDPSAYLSAKLSDDIIYSKNVLLYAPRRILQGFDLSDDGSIYYSQISSDGTSVLVCRASGPNVDAQDEYMTLKYFGHGTQISVENASDGKTYIWVNSNASVDSDGEYGNNWSFSRVEFTPGAVYEDGYAGDTFFLNKGSQYDQQVSIDYEARRLLVGSRASGVRYFWVFDLDEVLALPLKTMTVSVTIGSTSNDATTREISARDLNDCSVIGNFSVPAGTNTDTDVYSYSHQGHEIWKDYVYFYEGNALTDDNTNYHSVAYLTVFNLGGTIVVPRTEVAAIADVDGLKSYGMTTTGYAEGEGVKIRDGKIYLGIACRDGSSSNRYADLLVYDCDQGD